MSETVGSFLKAKLCNMARWVEGEVGKDNLTIDVVKFADDRSELEAVLLAEKLASKSAQIANQDWYALVKMLEKEDIPTNWAHSFACLLHAVKARDELHDKFWRYMQLFRDVVNKSNE
jgi:hypothetical protein